MNPMLNIKALLDKADNLPTLPGIAVKLLDITREPTPDLHAIADVLSTDPPLSGKVLKMINSPYYGLVQQITSVPHAVNLLGSKTVVNLALSFSLVNRMENGVGSQFDYSRFWKDSLISAITAKRITQAILPEKAEDAFFLGLLQDIGRLAIAHSIPEAYQEVMSLQTHKSCADHEAESQVLEFNHQHVGAYLVRDWNLPEWFALPIRHHHDPQTLDTADTGIDILTRILHLASLVTDFTNMADKRLYLETIEWFVQEYGFAEKIRLEELFGEVYAQAEEIFPLFDFNPGVEKSLIAMIETARNEIIDLTRELVQRPPAPAPAKESTHANAIQAPKIMIIDDEDRNIKLLKAILMTERYQVFGFNSGRQALDEFDEVRPDLILLDIMMPDLDGYEVCRQIKANAQRQMIPIVMVTALKDRESQAKAQDAGADDFLNKPVNATELRTRIRSLLRIKTYHDELAQRYAEIAAQNQRLQELERTKDGLTHMVIHDMRNPLTAILGNLQVALLDQTRLSPKQQQLLKHSVLYCSNLEGMIRSLLDINRLEEGKVPIQCGYTDIATIAQRTIDQLQGRASEKQITIDLTTPPSAMRVKVDQGLIQRVMANLLDNAIQHTPEEGQVRVKIEYQEEGNTWRFSVADTGQGLAPEFHTKIFDKFKRATLPKQARKRAGYGLGLAFCKMAVEAHQGHIWVESPGVDCGATFHFEIPLEKTESHA